MSMTPDLAQACEELFRLIMFENTNKGIVLDAYDKRDIEKIVAFTQQREAVGVAKGLRMAHAHFMEWFKNGFADIEDEIDWCEAKAKEVEHESSDRSHRHSVGPDSHE